METHIDLSSGLPIISRPLSFLSQRERERDEVTLMAERYQLTLSMPNVDQEMMAGAFHSQCTDLKYADCIKSVSFMRTEETSCATHQLLTNTELGSGFQARFSAL